MTIAEALAWGIAQLANLEDPRLEAEILLTNNLQLTTANIIAHGTQIIPPNILDNFKHSIARRLAHEPTAYIVGYQPFMGLDIKVDQRVLIPRPETELLVEKIFTLLPNHLIPYSPIIADIGTGSGCIAISLAKSLPNVKVLAIDLSVDALALAKENAITHGVNVSFFEGYLLSPLKEKVDLIVSNPPYIPTADLAGLEPDVKDWEPISALDGGPDGLDYIRRLINESPAHLNPGGKLMFEFGFGQAEAIKTLFAADNRYSQVEIFNDYAGIPRIVKAGI
ncbi:MAG: peptide chain release factor N(5)-glutamine methyltransferase [Candidatus Margulisiibacteriota bacterium]